MDNVIRNYCATAARESGESLCGTAPFQKTWLLLEYCEPWQKKAVRDNLLPAAVRFHLETSLTALPEPRLLFIKQDNREMQPLTCFLAVENNGRFSVYQRHFQKYSELLDWQFLHPQSPSFTRHDEALYLVCTNGKRDKCCAKFGLPIYHALKDRVGRQAWQCSHFGGHRFAPTLITFPLGAAFGRIHYDSVDALVTQLAMDEVQLSTFRGRVAFPGHIQAAEFFLLSKTNRPNPLQFTISETTALPNNQWRIAFRDRMNNSYSLHLLEYRQIPRFSASCDPDPPKPVRQYQLLGYEFQRNVQQ